MNANANRGEKSVTPSPTRAGVVLQVFDGHHFHESSSDRVTKDSLHRLAKDLSREIIRPEE